jgi:hypothetical protein
MGYGQPNEAFFHQNPKLLGLGKQFGQINFWAFGGIYQHPFWYCESLIGLDIQIQNNNLGSGFEFGPQRPWDLAIVFP